MKKLFQQRLPLFARFAVMLLIWVLGGTLPAAAQESDCLTHQPTPANVHPAAIHSNNTFVHDRGNGMAGEKLRVLIYYDPTTPVYLGISTNDWEARIRASVLKFDTTLHNICVFNDYDNIRLYVKPSTVAIPGSTNDAYQAAAIDQSTALYQMWTNDYQCSVPHIIGFIPPIEGASGVRGVSTVVWEQFAETMTAIMVIRADQVNNPSDLTMAHELGHATGGFHPSDPYAPNASYCGLGTTSDGHKSLMKSPTGYMTVMNEGRVGVSDCGALSNGISDVGTHWLMTYAAYIESRPDFSAETTADNFYPIADSQAIVISSYVNRTDVTYDWHRDGYSISNEEEFTFNPTTNDTGLVTFVLIATNCGGEEVQSEITVQVQAKPVANTTSTTDTDWTGFQMFPNPVSTTIHFDQPYDVQVFDMTGRIVSQVRNSSIIDVNELSKGLYIAVIEDSGQQTRRLFSKIGTNDKKMVFTG